MKEMDGFVLLVDSTDLETMGEARELISLFSAGHPVPYVVAANKQDLPEAARPEKLRRALDLPANVLIMPCVSSRKTSVKQVLIQMVDVLK
jgi:hypothetical protein